MLGLNGSHTTTRNMPQQKAEQLVLDQMDKDPSRRQGVQTIQAKIAFDVKQHLTRDFVSQVMHTHDKEGFTLHDPSSKQIFWVKKVPLGIHKHWAGNGHDKLYWIGFPIWVVVDDTTRKWLDAWVVPSNRLGHVIRYLFLCLIEKFSGEFILFFFVRQTITSSGYRNAVTIHNRLWLRDDTTRIGKCFMDRAFIYQYIYYQG